MPAAFSVSYINSHHTTTKVGDSALSAQRFAYWVAIFLAKSAYISCAIAYFPCPFTQSASIRYCQECLMSYKTQLFPWCIIRPKVNIQQIIVARFRRRSDAEAHLQILRQLLPNAPHTIIFDITLDNSKQDSEGAK
jgi:hypothetical protein